MRLRISKYILIFLSLATVLPASAQVADTVKTQIGGKIRGVQYDPKNKTVKVVEKGPLLSGFSVSGNLAGAILAATTSYGELEGAFRVNLRNEYFPIAELGLGISNHTDDGTNLHYKTHSPFFRIGCDYNFVNDKTSGNRIFGGARIAYTSFKYDISGPDLFDPVWHKSLPYNFKGLNGSQAWLEIVFGLEAKIWSAFHLGWSVRYKNRITHSESNIGEPWYVPGYGKKGSTVLGGTFNVILDI